MADDLRAGIEARKMALSDVFWAARDVGGHRVYWEDCIYLAGVAIDYFAAHPVQVTTAEELDALPVGSVVLDSRGNIRAYVALDPTGPALWWHVGEASNFPMDHRMLPATLLYRPEETP